MLTCGFNETVPNPDTARRSFDCLRLANFLFQPSLDIIQALLIVGNTLQNMGQSDAAWALLGTTIRLAQTMGLHTERSIVHWPEYVQTKGRALCYVEIPLYYYLSYYCKSHG